MWRQLGQDWKSLCTLLPGLENSIVRTTNDVPKKPKGKMPIHASFVKTSWEGHSQENRETPVNSASSKCSGRWTTVCGKDKCESDEMVKEIMASDQLREARRKITISQMFSYLIWLLPLLLRHLSKIKSIYLLHIFPEDVAKKPGNTLWYVGFLKRLHKDIPS